MARRRKWIASLGVGVLALGLTACAQQERGVATPEVEERTLALTPEMGPVRTAFLTGELRDMRVVYRVDKGSGRDVDPPRLLAELRLANASTDTSTRLIGGKIMYADRRGKLLPLAEGRGDTTFQFYEYPTARLDPGQETTQSIEVPFPVAAFEERTLGDIRIELDYMPTPYRRDLVSIDVSLDHTGRSPSASMSR